MEKKRIFKRYFDNSFEKRRIGIGLSLVQKIVNEFKGKIWVEDRIEKKYQKGSRFVISLPIFQNKT